MTMHTNNERAQRVESEYKKWEERFVIPFDKEFTVKTLIDLQDQFNHVPLNHTKEKMDLLHMIQRLEGSLNLKENTNGVKTKTNILFIAKEKHTLDDLQSLFKPLMGVRNVSSDGIRGIDIFADNGHFSFKTYSQLLGAPKVRNTTVIDIDKLVNNGRDQQINELLTLRCEQETQRSE